MAFSHIILGISIVLHIIATDAMHAHGVNETSSAPPSQLLAPPPPPVRPAGETGGVTDVPEEREIAEDVIPSLYGITRATPTEDPVEQHDAPPGAGAGAGVKATPPVNGRTAHVGQEQPTPYPYPAYPIMEDVEAEERLPGTSDCPLFDDATKEHHVIIRHENCEIFISPDDSIRLFGEPGISAPSVYVRNFA